MDCIVTSRWKNRREVTVFRDEICVHNFFQVVFRVVTNGSDSQVYKLVFGVSYYIDWLRIVACVGRKYPRTPKARAGVGAGLYIWVYIIQYFVENCVVLESNSH